MELIPKAQIKKGGSSDLCFDMDGDIAKEHKNLVFLNKNKQTENIFETIFTNFF